MNFWQARQALPIHNGRPLATESQVILDSIRRLVRFLRINDRASQTQAGLSAAQLFVLHELGKTPSLSLSDLAQRTFTDQSSVSVVVTRLVAGGHVSRDRDPADGRRLVLNLTKSGAAILERTPAPQPFVLEAIERLSPAERKQFAGLFARLIEELGESGEPAPMIEFDDGAKTPRNNE